MPRSKIKVEF